MLTLPPARRRDRQKIFESGFVSLMTDGVMV
jgi:hypothetical protein